MSPFLLTTTAILLISIGLLLDAPPRANAQDCPESMLFIVDSKLCVDSASQTPVDPSCCARLKTFATNPDGSARTIRLPKQCPESPIGYVKQTGACTSNGKAIDMACCDAIR
jgi:hypothetical protein